MLTLSLNSAFPHFFIYLFMYFCVTICWTELNSIYSKIGGLKVNPVNQTHTLILLNLPPFHVKFYKLNLLHSWLTQIANHMQLDVFKSVVKSTC